tara:strand:- start:1014 stop:2150 length:1137 start_codon:yes stop_codon:yes gene_type:complete
MPNIQIRGSQIQSESVEASNINLSGSFDFRAATGFQITTKAEADNSTFPATTAFVHTMVSGSIIDGFQGGDGISIDTSTSPDTIAVDLAANKGLEFSSAELQIKLDGSTLALGASGIKISDGGVDGSQLADGAVANVKIADGAVNNAKIASDAAIANSKLANSTISGVALGSNLASLSAGNGLSMTSYNGSTAVSNLTIDLDGSTLAVGADGIKIATNGVGGNEIGAGAVATANIADSAVSTAKIANLGVSTAKIADTAISTAKIANSAVDSSKLADDAVSTAKIADAAVEPAKLSFQAQSDTFSPDGSTSAFDLSQEVNGNFDQMVMAFKNGLLQRLVASSPANADEYTVSTASNTTTITFGANLNANDELEVRYLA